MLEANHGNGQQQQQQHWQASSRSRAMADIVIWVASIFFIVFVIRLVISLGRSSSSSGKPVPPGRLGLPVIGETLEWLGTQRSNRACSFYEERRAKFGPVFKTSLVASPTVVVPAPAGNKFLWSNENKLVVNSWPGSVARLLGPDSLTLKTGEDYKRSRQVLMAYLRPEALQRYVAKASRLSIEHLGGNWDGNGEVSVFAMMKSFTFSMACSLFLSLEGEAEQRELAGPFNDVCKGTLQLPLNFPGTRYHRALQSRVTILRLLDKHISQRKKDLATASVSREHDLLSVLLTTFDENKKLISDSEIKDNILLLLFAGHDTSSCTLTMIIKFLAENPSWKDRVLQEHLQILAEKKQGAAADHHVLNWEDTKKMKWTWRVVQESLRLQPPIQGSFRKAITDFEFAGFSIPKGWKLYWTVNNSHRRAEFFPNPDLFDPSRFEGDGPAPYTFVPFGGGPRMCPGYEFAKMEMLVFLHHLVVRYDWQLVNENEEISVDPMPFPKRGLPVKIQRR